jgi:hypothetical protein
MVVTSCWVQSWVQLEGLFQPKMARELSQINERVIDYEPESGVRVSRGAPFHKGLTSCPPRLLPWYQFAAAGQVGGAHRRATIASPVDLKLHQLPPRHSTL